jgi:YD repeat-containing protein
VEERDAYGNAVKHVYDAFGDKVRTTDAMGKVVGFSYDHMGRMLSMAKGVADVYGVLESWSSAKLDTRNITDTWTYDQLGRKLTQTNGNGETLSYTYDLQGNLVATRQPLGQITRSAYDAQGRKIGEVDANGGKSSWTYDYFGQLRAHMDLDGQTFTYTYDKARQLTKQTSTRGQSLVYTYDAAGQVTTIKDNATGKTTTYVYDVGGRKLRERVVQQGITYQDNHLAYDARGNLRDVSDARAHVVMEYDLAGNRTRISTYVDYQGVTGEASNTSNRYFVYDKMNRQIVVDGVDAAGSLGEQGHEITYDANGNRTSDKFWGPKVAVVGGQPIITGYDEAGAAIYVTGPTDFQQDTGYTLEEYRYDALNRLQSVVKDGMQIDLRLYDGADRVVQSGPKGVLNAKYAAIINKDLTPDQINGKEKRINRYDANGRLLQQFVRTSDDHVKLMLSWDKSVATEYHGTYYTPGGYDNVGNALGYTLINYDAGLMNGYSTSLAKFDGYQGSVTSGKSTKLKSGNSTQAYDANGFLVSIDDSTQDNNDRTFVNDANGRALFVNQAGNVQRQLIVNGEVLGRFGVQVDPSNPASGYENNPRFANIVDFDFGYAKVSASYPSPSPGAYTVHAGDTLQSIAQSAYGDSSLWFRIAEANGLSTSSDMRVGQTLNIPNRVGTINNNATTFKPYDPSRIEGDKTPSLAMPKPKKNWLGQLLAVVIAVVVSIFTAGVGAIVMSGGTLATASVAQIMVAGLGGIAGGFGVGLAAVAGAAGSVASQVFAVATGVQDSFDWKGVALSALSAGVAGGIGNVSGLTPNAIEQTIARAAIGNAVTQGVAVATGLQSKFDWKGVAASAVSAGMACEVAPSLTRTFGYFGGRLATSLLAGVTAATLRGGRLAIQQVAIDAFGNTLGHSLSMAADTVDQTALTTGDFTRMDRANDPYAMGYQAADGSVITSAEQLRRVQEQGDIYAAGPELRLKSLGIRGASRGDDIASQRASSDARARVEELERNIADLLHMEAMQTNEEYSASEARRLQARMQLDSDPLTFSSTAGGGLTAPKRGFFGALANGSEYRSVLDDTAALPLGEKAGLGLRGLVQMPFRAPYSVLREIGNQYADILGRFRSNYTPSSELVNSLQRNGIDGTLLKAGQGILSAPSQPLFDLLDGRYENAGAALPGAITFGAGAVRNIGLRAPVTVESGVYVIRYDPRFPGRPDPKFSIDTSSFVSPRDFNTAGFPRDAGLYWKQWAEMNPESLSPSNLYLIERHDALRLSPRIDATWIKAFEEHSSFMGDVLHHHHVDGGRYAIPVPGSTHRSPSGPWHY